VTVPPPTRNEREREQTLLKRASSLMRHIGVFSFMFANGRSECSAAAAEAPVKVAGASLTGADDSESGTKASFAVCDTVNCRVPCTGDCEASPLLCRPGPGPRSAKAAGVG